MDVSSDLTDKKQEENCESGDTALLLRTHGPVSIKQELCQFSFSESYVASTNCQVTEIPLSIKTEMDSSTEEEEEPGKYDIFVKEEVCLNSLKKERPDNTGEQKQDCGLQHDIPTSMNHENTKFEIARRLVYLSEDWNKYIQTHTSEKPFNCDICKSSFSRKYDLTLHTRTHTGEKPHNCDICKSSFSRKYDLTLHTRTHTGEKPFKCDVCERSFTQKYHLTLHIRTHTGEKPFKCDVCKKSFSQNHHLVDHIRTHTGVKPFNCDICEKSFSKKQHLTKHILTHSG